MKQSIFALLIVLTSISCFAQQKKDLAVSIAAGNITSPYYAKNKTGIFFGVDFDYHLAARHILSANYNHGGHRYYDNVLSNDPTVIQSDGSNAKAGYRTFSILYKYKLINSKWLSGTIGTGAGIMTHTREYPYAITNGSIYHQSTWSDLVFPVRLELDYKISSSFHLGLMGGFFIAPDFPVLAYHAGPRISYVIK